MTKSTWLAVLSVALALPAWAEEIPLLRPLRLFDFAAVALPPPHDGSKASERVSVDEAIAVALDVNRLVKNPGRLQRLRESVIQAHGGVRRAEHDVEIREDALRVARALDCLVTEQVARGEPEPTLVLRARAAHAKASADVVRARQELGAWHRQLNHLMGRDSEAPLLATGEPGPMPVAIRLGATAAGQ